MKKWYPKEFSKLTKVSVRTLHHYDSIGLLPPSVRLPNGFRLYSEIDLLKLQQIIALKFFGFTLTQIRVLFAKETNTLEHFKAQKDSLQSQIAQLQNAAQTLSTLISDLESSEPIHWGNVIQLIEEYGMTKETKMIWGHDSEQQKKYQDELIDIGLATQDQIDQCNQAVKHWKKEKVEKIKNEQDELFNELVAAINQNLLPSDLKVQILVRKHFENLKNFWTPTKASYIALGQFYCQHIDFGNFFKAYHPKLAEFLAESMKVFANSEL